MSGHPEVAEAEEQGPRGPDPAHLPGFLCHNGILAGISRSETSHANKHTRAKQSPTSFSNILSDFNRMGVSRQFPDILAEEHVLELVWNVEVDDPHSVLSDYNGCGNSDEVKLSIIPTNALFMPNTPFWE